MDSVAKNGTIYEFDDFRLIPGEDLLLRNGEPVPINPKAFRVLTLLVERNGHLVQKTEILDLIWEDSFVEEGSLSKAIWFVRQALGDTSKERFIQTVPRRGYRFVFPVSVRTDRSGAFRVADLPALEERPRAFPREQRSTTNGANGRGTGTAETRVDATDSVPEMSKAAEGSGKRASFFSRWTMLAGVAGIVVIASLLGYSSFARRGSAVSSRSLLVLPVTSMNTSEPDKLYQLGIADSLINELSSAEGLSVRSLNAVAGYQDAPKDPLTAGIEQKVDYVLACNYQIAGSEMKITCPLYRVTTGHVEETFQTREAITDIFAAQNAVAAKIGASVIANLGISAKPPLKKRGTDNEEAYLAYLQGMILLDNWTSGRKDSPLESFDKAVSLDPNYASAWAGKALAESYAGSPENDRGGEHYRKAREAIDKALRLNQNESLAYATLCHLGLFYEWNYAGAEEAGRRAVELDPTSPFARYGYAMALTARERFNEAVDQLKEAIEMQPTSVSAQEYYANALYMARRFKEAEAQYKVVVDLKPERKATYWWLVEVMEEQGKEAEAVEWTIKLMAIENKGDEAIERYRTAYERGGYKEALLERINQNLLRAQAYVQLGDEDQAFEGLEKQYQRHHYHLAVFGIVDPRYDPLRSDPRWADLVRRVRGE